MSLYDLAKERIAQRTVEETIRFLKGKQESDAEIREKLMLWYRLNEFQANQALREANPR